MTADGFGDSGDRLATGCGKVRVLWAIADADRPMTAREVAEKIGEHEQSTRNSVGELFHKGALDRTTRETESCGQPPYEYTLSDTDPEHE
jgi:predicted transcriptional regulator